MIRLDLRTIGGACAILYVALLVVFIGLIASVGYDGGQGAAVGLPVLEAHRTAATIVSILVVVMSLLLAVAGMGFFVTLRRGESLAWLALFGFVGGGIAIVYRGFVFLAMTTQLAPAYVNADAAGQATLAAVGNTLRVFALGADMIGAVLIAGTGVLIFSVLMLRSGAGPRWLAWIGIFGAIVGGWLTLLTKASDVAATVSGVGNVAYLVWMAAVGIIALRQREHPAEAATESQTATRPEAALG